MGNQNSGRRPQPTALTVLRGNPSRKKLNENEPRPPAGDIAKPGRLSPGAVVAWEELAPVCLAMGTLTTADVSAFATLCELRATLDLTMVEKGREGFSAFLLTTMVDSAGNEHQNIKEHPSIRLERNTAAALRPYYEKFGLEPVARARISVSKVKAEEPVSKWAGALK